MKIVGTHDELTLFKLTCQKHGQCSTCALYPFCERDSDGNTVPFQTPSAMLQLTKIKAMAIGGDKDDKE